MNKTFQTITSVLIIVLLFLLVWVFVSYYTSPVEVEVNQSENVNNSIPTPIVQNPVVNDNETVNDNKIDNVKEDEINMTDENTSSVIQVTEKIDNNKNEGSVIISSDPNISNAEKQQVLTEIDEALSELLVVVDSVTTVDETRLGIDEEVEVQP